MQVQRIAILGQGCYISPLLKRNFVPKICEYLNHEKDGDNSVASFYLFPMLLLRLCDSSIELLPLEYHAFSIIWLGDLRSLLVPLCNSNHLRFQHLSPLSHVRDLIGTVATCWRGRHYGYGPILVVKPIYKPTTLSFRWFHMVQFTLDSTFLYF